MDLSLGRRLSVALVVVCAVSLGGCLTVGPTVTADVDNSTVFERLSPTESWAASGVRVEATLRSTPEASNVTTITVVREDGRTFQSTTVDPGQSTVVFAVPAGQNVTLVASNSVNSTLIENLTVRTGGTRIP